MYTAIQKEIAKTIEAQKKLIEQLQLEGNAHLEQAHQKLQEKFHLEKQTEHLQKELSGFKRQHDHAELLTPNSLSSRVDQCLKSMSSDFEGGGISSLVNAPISSFDGCFKASGL